MPVLEDMCAITREHAGESLRYFCRVDPETGTVDVLHLREDLSWTDRRNDEVEGELHEVTAKVSYESMMDVDNVNQLIKVADSKVLFTGFVEDELAVAAFERGIFAKLPPIVADFRDYMQDHDVDFVSLSLE
ncbi:hypothetical protein ACOZ4N_12685 [Halorientalis pallida]|uniref:hypothetical protein n=1 Tax=Halorientalis pallida TaxID=2479928 RepID=UPI003C6F2AC0